MWTIQVCKLSSRLAVVCQTERLIHLLSDTWTYYKLSMLNIPPELPPRPDFNSFCLCLSSFVTIKYKFMFRVILSICNQQCYNCAARWEADTSQSFSIKHYLSWSKDKLDFFKIFLFIQSVICHYLRFPEFDIFSSSCFVPNHVNLLRPKHEAAVRCWV